MKVILLNLPSPPHTNIYRDYAGGFGLATPSRRTRHGHDIHVIPPLFDAYAATILEKEGVKASIQDAQVRDLNLTQLLQNIAKQKPNSVVGRISLPSFYEDLEVMNRIKETLPSTVIIGWGATCKVMPEETLMKSKLDLVIRDELEFTLPEVVKRIEADQELNEVKSISFKQNNKIIHNSNRPIAKNLDVLPLPAYHLLDIEKYVARESLFYPESSKGKLTRFFSVLSSRGCSYNCIYCPYPIGFGQPWRAMSAKKTVDEIEHLIKNYNVRGIWFRDQTFSMDIKRAMAICDEILNRGLDIRWVCETRADKLPPNLLKKMKKAGCMWIFIGVETGDPHLLRTIGKPGYTIEKIEQAFRMARQEGIRRKAFVMVGLPGESWKTIQNTRKLIEKIDPDILDVAIITPYPGTSLYQMAEQKGWLLTKDWKKYTGIDPVISLPNFSDRNMINARRFLLDQIRVKSKIKRIIVATKQQRFVEAANELKTMLVDFPQTVRRLCNLLRHGI